MRMAEPTNSNPLCSTISEKNKYPIRFSQKAADKRIGGKPAALIPKSLYGLVLNG
jgi:hypothetical protein